MKKAIDWARTTVIILVLLPLVCIVILGIFDIAIVLLASAMVLGIKLAVIFVCGFLVLLAIATIYMFLKSLGPNVKRDRTTHT